MAFKLPALPYSLDALSPHISKETLEYHYGKHHQLYVDKLNKALETESKYRGLSLEDIIRKSREGKVFNNAAQVWNHTFYWNCMSPDGGGAPEGAMKSAVEKAFGSFEDFQEKFNDQSATLFGSGWTWLVKDAQGELKIRQTKDAENPLIFEGEIPLLTCDMWEHAYYIDFRNAKAKYLEAFWKVVNWEFVESQLQESHVFAVQA